jgi:GAF domain-containing protein
LIVEAAPKVVPGARWAGISLVQGTKIVSEVPTSRAVAELDQLQSDLNQGPCLTALREYHTVHIDDMRTDTRWPEFNREAQQRGMLSMLAFQLFVRAENLGALNLYSGEPGAFSEDSFLIGEILAQHAAVAMIGAAAETQFENALATRDIIGQAKGMLMQRDNLTGLKAFSLLTRVSQETNIKLVDVARWLVNEHESKLEDRSTRRS